MKSSKRKMLKFCQKKFSPHVLEKICNSAKNVHKRRKISLIKKKHSGFGIKPSYQHHGRKRKASFSRSLSFLDDDTVDTESSSSEFDFSVMPSGSKQPMFISSGESDAFCKDDSISSDDSFIKELDASASSEELISDEEGNLMSTAEESDIEAVPTILTFASSTSSCFIIAVDHPFTFKFTGAVSLKVISGSINVLGYEANALKNEFVQVYSVPEICDLCFETKTCQAKSTLHCREIVKNLDSLVDNVTRENILTTINDSHVVMIILPKFDKCGPHFADFFYPGALAVPKILKNLFSEHCFNILEDDDSTIKFSKFHNDVVDAVGQQSFAFASSNGPAPRVLIYGKKNLGKSVALRYLVNRLLSKGFSRVLVLDADPGQSEFTIGGCVSLTEVRTPLLGPSYTHLQTPVKWKFVGEVSLDSSAMYFNHLNEIMEYFLENFSNDILVINTAGWVTGYGKLALDSLRKVLVPTIEVELMHRDIYANVLRKCNFILQEKSGYPKKFVIPSRGFKKSSKFMPADLRDIALLSYFGTLHHYWETEITSFNSFNPYCVSANDLAIHIIDSNENDDEQKIHVLNGSVIALCSVKPSEIWHCINNSVPKRLVPGSKFGECIGFGVVRAIDADKKLLYIVTPISIVQLQKVNALIKGKLVLPRIVYRKQNVSGIDLPYLSSNTKKNTIGIIGKKIKRRTYSRKY